MSSVDRIVLLSGDNTEVVFALGLGKNVVAALVGDTDFPDAKTVTQRIKFPFTAETLLGFAPTLVIGNNRSGPPPVLDQVRSAGVPVIITPQPLTIDGPAEKIQLLANALGVPDRGTALAQKYRDDVAAAEKFVATQTTKPRVLFLYVRGASGTQLAAGAKTEANVIIRAAGAIDAGAEAGITGYQPITPEAIIAAKPDAFLVLSLGLESVGGIDGLLKIPGLDQTPAGKARRVVDFSDCYLLCMGPRQGQAILDLAKAIRTP